MNKINKCQEHCKGTCAEDGTCTVEVCKEICNGDLNGTECRQICEDICDGKDCKKVCKKVCHDSNQDLD